MDWDFCYKPAKKRKESKKTLQNKTHHKTKNDLKIAPLICIQENQDKEQHRRATTSHRKAIPKEQQLGADFIIIESHDHDEACCRSFRSKFRHLFTSPDECMAVRLRIQHDDTHR